MLTLLKKDFPDYYRLTRRILVECKTYVSDFSLTDWKSCNDCQSHTKYFYLQCDKEVLRIATSKGINVINLEDYFQQYSDKKEIVSGGCCDLLLYEAEKVAFIDLTCTRPVYIDNHIVDKKFKEGKRPVAFKQLKDSIAKLSVCPTISTYLQKCIEKVAILALRKKEFAVELLPESPMQSFMKMANEQSKSGMIQDMGNGFTFIVHEYPKVYNW